MNNQQDKATIAVKKAVSLLKKIQQMMENHLDHCVKTALDTGSGAKKQQMIDEILRVSKIANK